MPDIYVDGDACPVKQEVLRVAERHGLTVYLVANSWMRLGAQPLLKQVVVGEGLDAADDWIAEHIATDDLVVTGDIPLAARCLARGALALNHSGKPFTPDNIGMALAMRDLKAQLRDSGEIKDQGPGFSKADRSRFLQALDTALTAAAREAGK
ncbi:MAG TPA: YaiI/YqxD family protein [Kiloniellaceae bacterium]|nr:YaiI/YqxD family protein [Kiloniellaceae bacterium]